MMMTMLMKMSMTTTLFCLLYVGLAHSASDTAFQLVIQNIDLLKSQVQLLQSRKIIPVDYPQLS